jgi:hypothetical protein
MFAGYSPIVQVGRICFIISTYSQVLELRKTLLRELLVNSNTGETNGTEVSMCIICTIYVGHMRISTN